MQISKEEIINLIPQGVINIKRLSKKLNITAYRTELLLLDLDLNFHNEVLSYKRKILTELFESGKTVIEVSKELHIAQNTVKAWCTETGVELPKRKKALISEIGKAVIKMYTEDLMTISEIAKQLEKPFQHIAHILRSYGYTKQSGGHYLKKRKILAKITKCLEQGLALEDIALNVGMTLSQLTSMAGNYKLPLPTIFREAQIEFHKDIVKLRNKGLTQKQIGEKLGKTQTCICEALKKMGLRTALTSEELIERNNKIIADHSSGLSVSELAKKYNLTKGSINKIVTKLRKV